MAGDERRMRSVHAKDGESDTARRPTAWRTTDYSPRSSIRRTGRPDRSGEGRTEPTVLRKGETTEPSWPPPRQQRDYRGRARNPPDRSSQGTPRPHTGPTTPWTPNPVFSIHGQFPRLDVARSNRVYLRQSVGGRWALFVSGFVSMGFRSHVFSTIVRNFRLPQINLNTGS